MNQISINIDGYIYNIPIIYKNVKRLRLIIKNENQILLIANKKIEYTVIDNFVSEHKKWLEKRINNINLMKEQYNQSENMIFLFGKQYYIKYTNIIEDYYQVYNDYIYVPISLDNKDININVREYYFNKIIPIFNNCLKIFNQKYNITSNLSFRKTKNRLGTCYVNKKMIILSKKLVHFSINSIEYVIYHELSHYIQANHSNKFYEVLKYFCPKYKENKKEILSISYMIN